MTNYNDGNWYGWNGGECPVHPETVVEVVYSNWASTGIKTITDPARMASWGGGDLNLIAFRVIKEHKEPREFWIRAGFAFEGCEKHKLDNWSGEIIHVKEVLE